VKTVGIGIAGLGTVSQGVLNILKVQQALLAKRSNARYEVVRVVSRTAKPDVDLLGAEFSHRLEDLYEDPQVDVVMELIGGESPADQLIADALAAGKAVITANKAVLAVKGDQLLGKQSVQPIRFEAAVAGAIPILQAITAGLAGNAIHAVSGIINGTANYILTAMEQDGVSFGEALAAAQKLGYAEADPTFDVDGTDAAHKLTILMALAFDMSFALDQIYKEGIESLTAEDIAFAAEFGFRIKHIGMLRRVATGLEARVHPLLIPQSDLLAQVDGVQNAVQVSSDSAGTTLFSGPGAGGAATASAVIADLVALTRGGLGTNPTSTAHNAASSGMYVPLERANDLAVLPIDEVYGGYYLRMLVADQPGVIAKVAQALSNHGISIDKVIQRPAAGRTEQVDLVLLTHDALERDVNLALTELHGMFEVSGEVSRIRVAPVNT
tara:strand:- start:9916 stop:11235 length:1320 start_codon:yes stop_codon:yes gene_type:complete